MKGAGIKALILQKFASETEMAKKMGWSKQRLNKITTGKQEPYLWQVQEIAKH